MLLLPISIKFLRFLPNLSVIKFFDFFNYFSPNFGLKSDFSTDPTAIFSCFDLSEGPNKHVKALDNTQNALNRPKTAYFWPIKVKIGL